MANEQCQRRSQAYSRSVAVRRRTHRTKAKLCSRAVVMAIVKVDQPGSQGCTPSKMYRRPRATARGQRWIQIEIDEFGMGGKRESVPLCATEPRGRPPATKY